MIVYFDSSALVKLLVTEPGSDEAAALWDGADAAFTSRIAYPEVRAALAAAGRSRRLSPTLRRQSEQEWERVWASIRIVELTARVAFNSGDAAALHALRGADAIHLASALAVGSDAAIFAAWDARLRSGARAAGFRLGPDSA